MITASDVARVASETGFRADVVEKVLRLHGILDRLDRHKVTHGTWLLKGGTALNLLHLDVPRLSVDIDVNYVGADDVESMRRARPDYERTLTSCCAREGCDVRRAPSEHAGGKFRLRYPSRELAHPHARSHAAADVPNRVCVLCCREPYRPSTTSACGRRALRSDDGTGPGPGAPARSTGSPPGIERPV